jgi:hypothetical protein
MEAEEVPVPLVLVPADTPKRPTAAAAFTPSSSSSHKKKNVAPGTTVAY